MECVCGVCVVCVCVVCGRSGIKRPHITLSQQAPQLRLHSASGNL